MRKKLIIILFTLLILFLGLILAISFFKERKFYDPAIRLVASVKTDSTMCSKIFDKNHKDICYGDVAKKTGNVELCNNVKSYYLKNWCFMYAYVANNDYQSCEKLGDQYQAGCYNYIAISLNNTELCKKVITPKSNQFSADRCIKSIEFNTNNSSYCLDQTQTAKK
jgi:hypothetical protein